MSQWQSTFVVLGVLIWWVSPASGLADLARREALRRELMPKAARTLTNEDASRMPPRAVVTVPEPKAAAEPDIPAATTAKGAAADPADAPPAAKHDEAWWRARLTTAQSTLERDQLLLEAMQTRINSLTNDVSSRDDPAQRDVLMQQRVRALAELDRLRTTVDLDRQAIDAIMDDARKQGVPPGWIR